MASVGLRLGRGASRYPPDSVATTKPYVSSSGKFRRASLPLNPDAPLQPDVLAYWKSVGDRIASPSPAVATIVNGEKVNVRTLTVRPDIAARIDADDLNVVVQRLDQPKFDLIVATNVFIYYDLLD